MGITGLSHLYFETKHYAETKKFWEGLGFKITLDLTHDNQGGGLYSNGNMTFMLREVAAEPIQEIYFQMQNPEQTAERLKADNNIKVTKDLFDSHWETKLIKVQDPDGRTFYLEAGHVQ